MRIIFNGDFERPIVYAWGSGEWHTPLQIGGDFSIIPDPTGSLDNRGIPRGKVLKLWASGSGEHTESGGALFWRHIYPAWMLGPDETVPAPCSIQVDVFTPKGIEEDLGLLGVHRYNMRTGDKISVAAYEIDGNGNLVLLARDGKGNDKRVRLKSGIFRKGEWNTLRIDFEPDGSIYPYVNGILAYNRTSDLLSVPVGDHPAGFADGHAGIIAANQTPDDGLDGIWILNDNFLIVEYE